MSSKLTDAQKGVIKDHLEANNPFEMQTEIPRQEDAFWAQRNQFLKKKSEESLASEGSLPLRSE